LILKERITSGGGLFHVLSPFLFCSSLVRIGPRLPHCQCFYITHN